MLSTSYYWGCDQDPLGMASTYSTVFCFCVQCEWDTLMGTGDTTVNRTYKYLHSGKFYSNERRQENKWTFCQRDYSLDDADKSSSKTGSNIRLKSKGLYMKEA